MASSTGFNCARWRFSSRASSRSFSSSVSRTIAGIRSRPASRQARQRRSPMMRLVALGTELPHDHGLEQTDLLDGGHQLGQGVLVEHLTRLARVGRNGIQRQLREVGDGSVSALSTTSGSATGRPVSTGSELCGSVATFAAATPRSPSATESLRGSGTRPDGHRKPLLGCGGISAASPRPSPYVAHSLDPLRHAVLIVLVALMGMLGVIVNTDSPQGDLAGRFEVRQRAAGTGVVRENRLPVARCLRDTDGPWRCWCAAPRLQ